MHIMNCGHVKVCREMQEADEDGLGGTIPGINERHSH